jgi:hypothetical protein
MWGCRPDLYVSGHRRVVCSCEHKNEPLNSIKFWEILHSADVELYINTTSSSSSPFFLSIIYCPPLSSKIANLVASLSFIWHSFKHRAAIQICQYYTFSWKLWEWQHTCTHTHTQAQQKTVSCFIMYNAFWTVILGTKLYMVCILFTVHGIEQLILKNLNNTAKWVH